MTADERTERAPGRPAAVPHPPLDPALAVFLESSAAAGRRALSAGTVRQAREQLAARAAAAPPGRELPLVRDHAIPLPGRELRVREYCAERPVATIVYLHGGGWTVGDVDGFDRVTREMAYATGARVLSVDYRLAPEHPFPAGLDDAWEALRWAAGAFAGSPLVVAGDSAGGNLAAVLAHRASEEGLSLAAQILLYPVTDHRLDRPSHQEYAEGELLLTTPDMHWFWHHYIPDPERRTDPAAAPLRRADLGGLPPAVVVVAGHDPLRDEVLEYAARLEAAGNEVVVLSYLSMGHAFISLLGVVEQAATVQQDIAARLTTLLTRGGI